MLSTIGIQPAEVSRILNLAKDIIPQSERNVNTKFSISEEVDTYSRTYDLKPEVNQVNQAVKEFASSEEYKSQMAKVMQYQYEAYRMVARP